METFWFFLLRFRYAYAYDSDFLFSLGHRRYYDSAYDFNFLCKDQLTKKKDRILI